MPGTPRPPVTKVVSTTGGPAAGIARLQAARAVEWPMIAAGASQAKVVAAGTLAVLAVPPPTSKANAASLATAVYQAKLGERYTSTWSQLKQYPGASFATGIGLQGPGGIFSGALKGVLPVLKIAAGGLIMLAAGGALVATALSKTPVGSLATGAVGVSTRGAKAIGASNGRGAAPRPAATPRRPARPDVAADRERVRQARVQQAEARAAEARSEAYVAKGFEAEARRARTAKVLPRIKGPANRPGGTRPKRVSV